MLVRGSFHNSLSLKEINAVFNFKKSCERHLQRRSKSGFFRPSATLSALAGLGYRRRLDEFLTAHILFRPPWISGSPPVNPQSACGISRRFLRPGRRGRRSSWLPRREPDRPIPARSAPEARATKGAAVALLWRAASLWYLSVQFLFSCMVITSRKTAGRDGCNRAGLGWKRRPTRRIALQSPGLYVEP
jgi:hypothetical protein